MNDAGVRFKSFHTLPHSLFYSKEKIMTSKQKEAIREYLKTLNGVELKELRDEVDEEIADQYWCDENFWMRNETDSFIYIVVYKDLKYYYHYLGKKAYDKYMEEKDAIRIEYKTKDLFPTYGVLMSRGEL